jgi:hypothetical protein
MKKRIALTREALMSKAKECARNLSRLVMDGVKKFMNRESLLL